MEPVDRRPAARPNGSGDRHGDATAAPDPRKGHRGARADQQRCIRLQAPRRTRLPATRLVRDQPTTASADDHDDRRGVQHPRRLGSDRQCGERRRRIRRRPRWQRAGTGLRRCRRRVQQRHRMCQRQPRQRRGPPHQRCCAIYGFALRRERAPQELGARGLVDGRHMRRRPRRDASRHVQCVRGHRRRQCPQHRHQGPDDRAPVRGERRSVRSLRSDDGDERSRHLHRPHRMVRHQRPGGGAAQGRRRIHCARWEAPTGSPVRSWSSPASTTGRSLRMRSTPRCRGWPANWALPPCRRSRCRHRPPPSVPIVQTVAK